MEDHLLIKKQRNKSPRTPRKNLIAASDWVYHQLGNAPILLSGTFSFVLKTGFARDSGCELTFSKLPKVIQVQWKLPKQKDFYILIYGSFNQNRRSLLSNVVGGGGDKCRRLLMAADDTMEVPT